MTSISMENSGQSSDESTTSVLKNSAPPGGISLTSTVIAASGTAGLPDGCRPFITTGDLVVAADRRPTCIASISRRVMELLILLLINQSSQGIVILDLIETLLSLQDSDAGSIGSFVVSLRADDCLIRHRRSCGFSSPSFFETYPD
ncbi:hypothetical protein FHL15_009178 [Xylaria flabelliformis]|uniref:Uncharacterized protein n=1 Tax=Xylaria flabelliformis TaxID=2512241 RepID=A0A553HPM2_9PEZI|nr:hypothetical protein FHL15_009178 [Xylaria flabelliformis]